MTFVEIAQCAAEAARLLADFPATWLGLAVVFLVVVEGLMFLPYVGFLAKLGVAALVGAQVLVLFAAAAAGQPPQLQALLGAFALPLASQAVLVSVALLPFFAGLVFLFARGGASSIVFFFGNILKNKPPARDIFFVFKGIMYVFSLPFTFVAAAVTLKGLAGWSALVHGVLAAIANWPALLAILAMALAFEWAVGKLSVAVPRPYGGVAAGVLLVAFVVWSFAFAYTLSVKAFDNTPVAGARPEN